MDWTPQYILSYVEIGTLVTEKNIFEGFDLIRAWQPSRSCDPGPPQQTFVPPTQGGFT